MINNVHAGQSTSRLVYARFRVRSCWFLDVHVPGDYAWLMTWDQYTGHERQVAELHYHWGDAYAIEWTCNRYRAYRRDTGLPLVAETVDELHTLILANYTERPVSRDFTPRES